jgi:tetratricopeptide (TPR) repeat protein
MHHNHQPRLGVGKVLLVLVLLLVVNSAYLAAFGDPTLSYVVNALLHPLLGLVATVLLFWRLKTFGYGLLASVSGIYLMIVGMTRPHSLALYIHVGLAIFVLILFLGQVQSFADEGRTALSEGYREWARPYGRVFAVSSVVMVGSLVFYGAAAIYHRLDPDPKDRIKNPPTAPLRMEDEGGGAGSLLFPSSAVTANGKTIPAEFFLNSESCKQCHPDIYNQWFSSMHHFGSFNNQWYRKSIEYMQDTIGIKPSLWCGGCHDHALVFANQMQRIPIREIEHTPEGQAGLGCMSCHTIVQVKSTMGQGNFVVEYPALDRLASSKSPLLRRLHDFAVKLNPKPHRSVFLKPFHKQPQETPEFCSVCHKVHLDVPVNHYRWIRGFDDYDNWQASGVSGQGARSFYYPPRPQQCADCHMPLVPSKDFGNLGGFVHSHRFAAANTAVPTAYGDREQVAEVERFLTGALSVDIFALAEEPPEGLGGARPAGPGTEAPQLASTFAVGEESAAGLAGAGVSGAAVAKLIAPLGRVDASLHRGDTVRVEVVVRTLKLGHFFPGGTVDAFDCWLELQGRDSRGRVVFWSGEAADNGHGPVEPGAHFYRSLQLDAHGNPINKRNAWSTRATMYAHLIPPGAADTVHFRLKVPEDCGGALTFIAKLNYRKFSWWNTQWAFAGIRDPFQPAHDVTPNYDDTRWVFKGDLSNVSAKFPRIPDLPTVVIAEDVKTVRVVPRSAHHFTECIKIETKDRSRWNDYGIGLLLQGDLKAAERAFTEVTEADPKYADGWVNIARARIQEGNTDAAKPLLEKALQLNPKLASAHYFLGLALKADGKYPEAFEEFSQAAVLYPRDRVVRNQMGRMLFLQREYRRAVDELKKSLDVDPEDLEAHYNLMLCYRGLGDDADATREEKLYLRFKADESSRAITGPYKLAHPEDNNEAQPIHEHVSVPLGETEGSKQYAESSRQEHVARTSDSEVRGSSVASSPKSAGGAGTK